PIALERNEGSFRAQKARTRTMPSIQETEPSHQRAAQGPPRRHTETAHRSRPLGCSTSCRPRAGPPWRTRARAAPRPNPLEDSNDSFPAQQCVHDLRRGVAVSIESIVRAPLGTNPGQNDVGNQARVWLARQDIPPLIDE